MTIYNHCDKLYKTEKVCLFLIGYVNITYSPKECFLNAWKIQGNKTHAQIVSA